MASLMQVLFIFLPSSISVSRLKTVEPKAYHCMKDKFGDELPAVLYFNKGLWLNPHHFYSYGTIIGITLVREYCTSRKAIDKSIGQSNILYVY